jgi:hypothetical protein
MRLQPLPRLVSFETSGGNALTCSLTPGLDIANRDLIEQIEAAPRAAHSFRALAISCIELPPVPATIMRGIRRTGGTSLPFVYWL